MPRWTLTLEERFWSKVDTSAGPTACWPWMAGVWNKGYGKFRGPERFANRMSWLLTNGPIPNGLFVLHRCDNPPCCNPLHLFLGTKGDNIRDAIAKGRWTCPTRKWTDAQNAAARPAPSRTWPRSPG